MSDVSKTNEMIAEAREAAVRSALWDIPHLLFRLADALEAAARVPVQGEPNGDREALANLLDEIHDPLVTEGGCNFAGWSGGYITGREVSEAVDVILAAVLSRAVVPGAATELKSRADVEMVRVLRDDVKHAEAERDTALAAGERVRALHVETPETGKCRECTVAPYSPHAVRWPCGTIAALDGAPEPEWEHSLFTTEPDGSLAITAWKPDEFEQARKMWPDIGFIERRRIKAPWLPVEGEVKP